MKYSILSFGKCLNIQISGFQEGDIFWIVQYWTEKILESKDSCFRTASLGGSELNGRHAAHFS